ncbi:hypothetical protein CPLU01_02853 [Colletotrichum plurivorum]|uniref:Uncharacterized protein n=1 Tax=Colletotrichum plurivorum TaxID=2175906 RepID=A0A8H6KU71_9PEZI|nr:hypothetical protein CPLU01_02853 [Colletotrichum plurivorum]
MHAVKNEHPVRGLGIYTTLVLITYNSTTKGSPVAFQVPLTSTDNLGNKPSPRPASLSDTILTEIQVLPRYSIVCSSLFAFLTVFKNNKNDAAAAHSKMGRRRESSDSTSETGPIGPSQGPLRCSIGRRTEGKPRYAAQRNALPRIPPLRRSRAEANSQVQSRLTIHKCPGLPLHPSSVSLCFRSWAALNRSPGGDDSGGKQHLPAIYQTNACNCMAVVRAGAWQPSHLAEIGLVRHVEQYR